MSTSSTRLPAAERALRRARIFAQLLGGQSIAAIAAEGNVTPRRVRQIIEQALAQWDATAGAERQGRELLPAPESSKGRKASPQPMENTPNANGDIYDMNDLKDLARKAEVILLQKGSKRAIFGSIMLPKGNW